MKNKTILIFLLVLLIALVGVIMVSAVWGDSTLNRRRAIINYTSAFGDSMLINGTGGLYNNQVWGNISNNTYRLYYNLTNPAQMKLFVGSNARPFEVNGRGANLTPSQLCYNGIYMHFENNDTNGLQKDSCRKFGNVAMDGNMSRNNTAGFNITPVVQNNKLIGRGIKFKYATEANSYLDVSSIFIKNTTGFSGNNSNQEFNRSFSFLAIFYYDQDTAGQVGNSLSRKNQIFGYSSNSTGSNGCGISMYVKRVNGSNRLASEINNCRTSPLTDYNITTGSTNVSKGWHMATLTSDKSGTGGGIRLYLDNYLDHYQKLAPSERAWTLTNPTNRIEIGRSLMAGVFNSSSNLTITEFRFYNNTNLSLRQISAFYNSTFFNKTNNFASNGTESLSVVQTPTNPKFFNATMFNGTKRRFLNTSISTISAIINDTNVKLEIRGLNGTHSKTNVSVNVTRRGNAKNTSLFFTALNRNGSFKVNTTELKNLTRYGNYTIFIKLSSNNGTNTTTRNFTILNQMVRNQTMLMLPNSTPKVGSSINLTFNFTDDYAGSVDLNLTLRRRGGVIVQLNKTHFRLLGTPQNASPSRLQSNNFLLSFNGTWNISAQFTDGNGSKRMSNYSFSVGDVSSETPSQGGGGSVPVVPPIVIPENETIEEAIAQGEAEEEIIGDFVPAPFTPELTNLAEEDLDWSLTATDFKQEDSRTFSVLPNRIYRGSFQVNNFDTDTQRFERSCNGIFCDRVDYDMKSTPIFLVEGSNSKVVYFEYDTTGLNFFDSVEFNNIVTDDEGKQKIFTVFIEVSPFAILLVAWQWWVLGFIVMVLWILSIRFYYNNFSEGTKKSTQNIVMIIVALILLIGIGLAPLYLPVPATITLLGL